MWYLPHGEKVCLTVEEGTIAAPVTETVPETAPALIPKAKKPKVVYDMTWTRPEAHLKCGHTGKRITEQTAKYYNIELTGDWDDCIGCMTI